MKKIILRGQRQKDIYRFLRYNSLLGFSIKKLSDELDLENAIVYITLKTLITKDLVKKYLEKGTYFYTIIPRNNHLIHDDQWI